MARFISTFDSPLANTQIHSQSHIHPAIHRSIELSIHSIPNIWFGICSSHSLCIIIFFLAFEETGQHLISLLGNPFHEHKLHDGYVERCSNSSCSVNLVKTNETEYFALSKYDAFTLHVHAQSNSATQKLQS